MSHLLPLIYHSFFLFFKFRVFRFRVAAGNVYDGSCRVKSSTEIICTVPKDVQPGKSSTLHFDISVNNIDYFNDFTVLRMFQPATVLGVKPSVFSTTGNDPIEIYAINLLDSGYVLTCQFTYVTTQFSPVMSQTTVAASSGSNHVTCLTPTLPLNVRGAVDLSIIQSGFTLYGPVSLSVQVTPTLTLLTPTTVITGYSTSVYILFNQPNKLNLDGIINNIATPIRMLNSTYGFFTVQLMQSGVFPVTVSHYGSNSLPLYLTAIDSIKDLIINTTAIISSVFSYVRISSLSCKIPIGAFCQSNGADTRVMSSNNCEIICVIMPTVVSSAGTASGFSRSLATLSILGTMSGSAVNSIYFRVCLSLSCDPSLLSSTINILSPSVIAAVLPFSGTTLGGTVVTLIGYNFINDNTLRAVFGDVLTGNNSVVVTYVSNTRLMVTSPPGLPSRQTITLLRQGVIVSRSITQFEYISLLSNIKANTTTVLSIGGTGVTFTTPPLVGYLKPIGEGIILMIVNVIVMAEIAYMTHIYIHIHTHTHSHTHPHT